MKVASADKRKVAQEVDLPGDGGKAQAMVDACSVQLVDENGLHGTMTLNATGANVAAAESLFAVGSNVDVTFSK